MARIWDGIGCPDFGLTRLVKKGNNTNTRWLFVVTKSAVKMYVYERRFYGMSDTAKLVATF